MGENPLRVGIVGSRKYENRRKIKEFIFKLKNEKGIDTVVVGNGGKIGAGKYVKKENTIQSFKGILDGEYDHIPEQAFSYVGGIEDVLEKESKVQQ